MPGTGVTDQVVAFLQSKYPQPNPFWKQSTANTLPADWLLNTPTAVWGKPYANFKQQVAGSYPDFELSTCTAVTSPDSPGSVLCAPVKSSVKKLGDQPVDLSVGHSHQLYEAVYDTMLSAKALLDVTTLTPPTAQCLAAFRNAITAISTKPANERPVIRILYSNPWPNIPRQDAAVFLKDITRDVVPGAAMQIYVVVMSLGNMSWNHAKIVAADGERSLVGGHNLWGPDYLGENPVFDISMRMSGDAAVDAHDYADYVWSLVPDRSDEWKVPYLSVQLQASYTYNSAAGKNEYGTHLPPAGLYQTLRARFAPTAGGDVKVLSIGRHAHADWSEDDVPFPVPYYNSFPAAEPADDALLKLLDLAQTSIRICQQNLFFGLDWAGLKWDPLMAALVAAIRRGVNVYVVVSNPTLGAYGGPSLAAVNNKILSLLKAAGMSDITAKALIADKFQAASIRYSSEDTYPKSQPILNHAKTLMVDDRVFYIGSENLYPADLNEFGYIVEDAAAASTYLSQYWTPLWNQSKRTVLDEYSDDAKLAEQTEAMQFLVALRKNQRLNETWADTIASRQSGAPPDTAPQNVKDAYKYETGVILEELIMSAGFSARAGVVAATLQLPFFQDSGATPNAASDKFVADIATNQALLVGFVQVLNEPNVSPSKADGDLTSYLKGKGYDCTGRQVNASLDRVRRNSLAFWIGFYSEGWIRADGGAYFETCRPRTAPGAGAALRAPRAATAGGAPGTASAPIALPGPSFSIFGNTAAAIAKDQIIKPTFANGVLTWAADPSDVLSNATSGWVAFSEITRPTANDPFVGLECYGAITYPDDGVAPLKGKVSFYARKTSDTPPDIPPRVDADSVSKQSNYIGWIVAAVLGGAAVIGVGAYLGYRSYRSADEVGWRKKTDAESPDDVELEPLNRVEPTAVSQLEDSVAAGEIPQAQFDSLRQQSIEDVKAQNERTEEQFEEDNKGVDDDVPEVEDW